MATDSDIKLTKYKSTVTVVTADFANSVFGGLYGSADASSLDEDDPRVRGHVHDGQRGDGHGPKVDLVDHVVNKLTNHNLGDDAVMKRNVYDGIHVEAAIPEYADRDGVRYFYLDLRHIRADLVFQEDENPGLGQHKLIRQRNQVWDDTLVDVDGNPAPDYVDIPDVWGTNEGFDFVFGSSSLDDLNSGADGNSRLQFDKSKSAFRAGRVNGDQWDNTKRGTFSVALGFDTEASGTSSTVSGGDANKAEAFRTTVSGGYNNVATDAAPYASISGGEDNLATAEGASIGGGFSNKAHGTHSGVGSGYANKAQGIKSYVGGGNSNESLGDYSAISGGNDNEAGGEDSFVGGGKENFSTGKASIVAGGYNNKALGEHTFVGGGSSNSAGAEGSVVTGGGGILGNTIEATSNWAVIGGGERNEISAGKYSTIAGGEGSYLVGNYGTISGGGANIIAQEGSTITGGVGNIIDGKYSTISGGAKNYTPGEPKNSVLGSSHSRIESGANSTIVGGDGCLLTGTKSIIIGGSNDQIRGSDRSLIVGHGADFAGATPSIQLTIGVGYTSFNGVAVPESPSPGSGIIGGFSNHIVGGPNVKADANYIIGGFNSRLGAVDKATILGSQIFGGADNEITAFGGDNSPPILYLGTIVGGTENVILMGQASGDTVITGIFGGFGNSINHVPHAAIGPPGASPVVAPWFEPQFYQGQAELGVQTSYVIGGTKNAITNSNRSEFKKNSLYSSTLGGQHNVISSSYGSSILGGGAFVDVIDSATMPVKKIPPYDTVKEYYSNVIDASHHSSVLNGSSNLIQQYHFPFNVMGPTWADPPPLSKYGKVALPVPLFCIAQGRESYSYLYGQNAYASGGHNQEKFRATQDFYPASIHHSPPDVNQLGTHGDYRVQLGSDLDSKGFSRNQPGTAQISTLEFFGSWKYNKVEIYPNPGVDLDGDGTLEYEHWWPSSWEKASFGVPTGVGNPYFEFRSYLCGGRDSINANAGGGSAAPYGKERCFIPRFPASYHFVINGSLSYTDMKPQHGAAGGKYGIGHHDVIYFTYHGYMVVQPDGGGKYGGTLTNTMCSDPNTTLSLFDPTAGRGLHPGADFCIGFCPHWLIGDPSIPSVGEPITPENAYQDTVVAGKDGSGTWCEPAGGHHGVRSWPPQFSLYVVNNTGDPAILDPTGIYGVDATGRELIGESLVAKVDVMENLLFLGKYNPPIPGTP